MVACKVVRSERERERDQNRKTDVIIFDKEERAFFLAICGRHHYVGDSVI